MSEESTMEDTPQLGEIPEEIRERFDAMRASKREIALRLGITLPGEATPPPE